MKHLLKSKLRQYGMVVALVFIALFFQILTKGVLFRANNIANLVQQNSYILILAVGMLLVIITGNIDLSVGSIVALTGAILSVLIVDLDLSPALSFMLALTAGLIIGLIQGYWIAFFNIPGFIVTLAGMLIFRGLTLVVLQGQSKGPFPKSLRQISSGFLPQVGPGELHVPTLVLGGLFILFLVVWEISQRKQNQKYHLSVPPIRLVLVKLLALAAVTLSLSVLLASEKGIPTVMLLLLLLVLVYAFLTRGTVIGRHAYAVGGNMRAAHLSGVKTKLIVLMAYANMGLLAALAGVVFATRLNVASPKAGQGFELDAIAACFIGGAATTGGVGSVMGAIIGGLVMGILNNGMSIMGVNIDWQQVVKGLVLLLAVAFDLFVRKHRRS